MKRESSVNQRQTNSVIEKIVKKRFPEPVALVICRDPLGKVNLCPFGFFALMAWEPKVWAIGSYEKHYTTKVIDETGEFTLCLPSLEQIEDVIYCGSVSGQDVDKTKSIKLKLRKGLLIKVPIVGDAVACFECRVIQKVKVADHIIFFGEVLAAHESGKNWQEKIYNWDDKKLGTIKLGDESSTVPYSPEGEDS